MESTEVSKIVKYAKILVNLLEKIFFPLWAFGFLIMPYLIPLWDHSASDSMKEYKFLGWNVTINNPSTVSFVLLFLLKIGVVVALFIVLNQLNKFLKNVLDGKSFISENGKHLRVIGWVMILTALVNNLVASLAFGFGKALPMLGAVEKFLFFAANVLGFVLSPYLLLGIIFYLFGEIIINGTKIKQENDLTV